MFQTMYNPFPAITVVCSRDSKTVPDMSFTPREILAKFSRGERVPLGFDGHYDSLDDPDQDKYLDEPGMDPDIMLDDPTRDPEFDFGDYVEEKIALKKRQKAEKQKRAREERQKAASSSAHSRGDSDLERKASDEESSASEATKRETTSGKAETSRQPTAKSD